MRSPLRYALGVLFVSCAVVATASSLDSVRFAASPSVVQMRIEVRSAAGSPVYDSEWKEGNLLDWSAGTLPYGSYSVRIFTKDLEGRTAEKQAVLRVAPDQMVLDPAAGDDIKLTTTLHDGESGQLVTTSGDLSFRFGDFLNRKDTEAMRLSAQGDLDVAGLVRTGKGIVFPDGSIQRSAAMPTIVRMRPSTPESDKKLNPKSEISGAGTTNQVTKWLDGPAGTVGDSAIAEVGGKVGIGTLTPGGQLHIFGASNLDVFAGMGPDVINGPGFNYGYAGNSFGVGAGFFNVRPATGATGVNPSLRFMTVDQQRMIITNAGNVGIGTSSPAQKLDVAGNVHASGDVSSAGAIDAGTQFNISGQRVLSADSSNLFAGVDAGTFNANTQNTFVGASAGHGNTSGYDNSFFGYSSGQMNAGGAGNSFFGYVSGSNATGSNNSAFGFGTGSGQSGSNGISNSFFGAGTGSNFSGGSYNAAVGYQSAYNLTAGDYNAFVGTYSGFSTGTGSENTFIGHRSGFALTTESFNTMLGSFTNGTAGITNATAIGSKAFVTQSNSLVLGSINGTNGATANTRVGIGTTAPIDALDVRGGNVTIGPTTIPFSGTNALYVTNDNGNSANSMRIDGADNTLYISANQGSVAAPGTAVVIRTGNEQDRVTVDGVGNTGIGTGSPKAKLDVAAGDGYFSSAGNGVILKSPNGLVCRKLTIDNSGTLTTAAITCP
jgi:hypothetical protein